MRRTIARCIKFKEYLLAHAKLGDACKVTMHLTTADIQVAELAIIKLLQNASFANEIADLESDASMVRGSSSLRKLDPFLDDEGVLRVGGRVQNSTLDFQVKHPVLLPKDHHISECILRHFHRHGAHQGRGMTLNALRSSGFWIIGASRAIARLIAKCVSCKKIRAQFEAPKMADLPRDRVEPAPPFTHCGVDYFGPWYIKDGRKEVKRYGVIFTCLSSRAVHLETAVSMDTDSFINALRRFISIRGPIRTLRSDQGINFIGAQRELREALGEMDKERVHHFLLESKCDFVLNPPSASHMGGVWERQIRSKRSVLSGLLQHAGSQLNDESLRTLMCETAAIIKSRPLTVENLNDPTSFTPLTPNNLLTTKTSIVMPPPGSFQRPDLYCRKRWRRVQHLAEQFWKRWQKEYLLQLQQRQKWTRTKRNLQKGDIVLIRDDNLPRCQWKLGRVSDATPGSDNQV